MTTSQLCLSRVHAIHQRDDGSGRHRNQPIGPPAANNKQGHVSGFVHLIVCVCARVPWLLLQRSRQTFLENKQLFVIITPLMMSSKTMAILTFYCFFFFLSCHGLAKRLAIRATRWRKSTGMKFETFLLKMVPKQNNFQLALKKNTNSELFTEYQRTYGLEFQLLCSSLSRQPHMMMMMMMILSGKLTEGLANFSLSSCTHVHTTNT